MATVQLNDLHKTYLTEEIIKGVSLSIEDKEFVVFVGPSGCGKSTLGGFNRSSQHLNIGGVDDDRETEIGAVHKAQIVLARTAACLAA